MCFVWITYKQQLFRHTVLTDWFLYRDGVVYCAVRIYSLKIIRIYYLCLQKGKSWDHYEIQCLFASPGALERKAFHFSLQETNISNSLLVCFFLQRYTNYGSYSTLNIMKWFLGQEGGYKQKPLFNLKCLHKISKIFIHLSLSQPKFQWIPSCVIHTVLFVYTCYDI